MKRCFFTLLILGIISCGTQEQSNLAEKIIGNWEYDIAKMQKETEGKSVSQAELNLMMGMVNRFQGIQISFLEDGAMKIKMADLDRDGQWELSKDEKFLKMNITGEFQPAEISIVTDTSIILAPEPDRGMIFRRILKKID